MLNYKLSMLLLVVMLSGCATAPEPKEVIVYKTKEVYIPVPCDVTVTCEFAGEGYTPTVKLLRCVEDQKRALEYCKQVPTGR